MYRSILVYTASAALIFSTSSSAMQGRGHGGSAKPPTTKPAATGHGATTHGHSGAATHGQSAATTHGHSGATTHAQSGATTHGHGSATSHGHSGTTTHRQSASHGSAKTKPVKAGKHDAPGATTPAKSKTSKSTTTATTSTPSGTGTTTLGPVQQKLQRNTKLADKLQTRLPAGTDLMTASAGFKNLGQFVAAVNVSNNLGLKFTDLKTRMVDQGMSLGQAIQDVKKTPNVQTEVRRAEKDAKVLIDSTSTPSADSRTAPRGKAKPRTTVAPAAGTR